MNLHANKQLLKDAILATAQSFDIREIYVEKDYWVLVALYEIFHSHVAEEAVFKGGTALSKCHKLIERFSEDIDIVVFREEGENDNQLKKKIRAIGKVVDEILPEIEVKGLTNKKGNIRKTVHQYDKLYDGNFGPVSEHIVLESTWLGSTEPHSEMPISSYIHDMMVATGQDDLIEQHNLAPFNIRVLSKLRTFCEKVMSLVRFSRSEDPIADLRNKVRHVYDIHQLLKDEEIEAFFQSPDFDKMLIRVGQDDMMSYKNNNAWVPEHPSTAMIFDKPTDTWSKLSSAYKGNFSDVVTGTLPTEGALITTLQSVADRLRQVEWELA